eukprot:CAMPEP_0178912854 /NCGR_PEP_ID=MMETSP0786-20121207/10506_1 /TAXON_ID=186022 /ORGANISM="Thalassionema frauenfeldii, Strain CCMP 1798" /LENGTH=96 /DNA_ID=CAMNT_0020585507 /DNA_START=550 /DNA_END=837 /DNA_ORIENTATION=+
MSRQLTSDEGGRLLNGEHHASRQLSNSTWNRIKKLLPSDGAGRYDYFGYSVAVSGDMVVVGAYWDDDNNLVESGSAYIFNATTGAELHKLVASDGA